MTAKSGLKELGMLPPFLKINQKHKVRNEICTNFLDQLEGAFSKIILAVYTQENASSKISGWGGKFKLGYKLLILIVGLIIIQSLSTLYGEVVLLGLISILALFGRAGKHIFKKAFVIAIFYGGVTLIPGVLFLGYPWELLVVAMLRIFNSLALSFLFIYSVSFKELSQLPRSVFLLLFIFYKTIYTLARAVLEMIQAKKSRTFGCPNNNHHYYWISGRAAMVFKKCQHELEELARAFHARGSNIR